MSRPWEKDRLCSSFVSPHLSKNAESWRRGPLTAELLSRALELRGSEGDLTAVWELRYRRTRGLRAAFSEVRCVSARARDGCRSHSLQQWGWSRYDGRKGRYRGVKVTSVAHKSLRQGKPEDRSPAQLGALFDLSKAQCWALLGLCRISLSGNLLVFVVVQSGRDNAKLEPSGRWKPCPRPTPAGSSSSCSSLRSAALQLGSEVLWAGRVVLIVRKGCEPGRSRWERSALPADGLTCRKIVIFIDGRWHFRTWGLCWAWQTVPEELG